MNKYEQFSLKNNPLKYVRLEKWIGECLRKKKLRIEWADRIIKEAAEEGTKLYKYRCPNCQKWHLTKQEKHQER